MKPLVRGVGFVFYDSEEAEERSKLAMQDYLKREKVLNHLPFLILEETLTPEIQANLGKETIPAKSSSKKKIRKKKEKAMTKKKSRPKAKPKKAKPVKKKRVASAASATAAAPAAAPAASAASAPAAAPLPTDPSAGKKENNPWFWVSVASAVVIIILLVCFGSCCSKKEKKDNQEKPAATQPTEKPKQEVTKPPVDPAPTAAPKKSDRVLWLYNDQSSAVAVEYRTEAGDRQTVSLEPGHKRPIEYRVGDSDVAKVTLDGKCIRVLFERKRVIHYHIRGR